MALRPPPDGSTFLAAKLPRVSRLLYDHKASRVGCNTVSYMGCYMVTHKVSR